MTDFRERVLQEIQVEPGTTTLAPRGKRCSRCLCCMAVIAFDGEFLCDACDEGTHPALAEAKTLPPPQPQPAAIAAAPESRIDMASKGIRTPDDVRAQIVAEGFSLSARALAEKYGVNDSTINLIRKEAGLRKSAAKGAGPKPGAHPQHKPARAAQTRRPAALALTAHREPDASLSVPVTVNHRLLDSWFEHLPLDAKAALFVGNFAIPLLGTVD
jgi:hypothetical protein